MDVEYNELERNSRRIEFVVKLWDAFIKRCEDVGLNIEQMVDEERAFNIAFWNSNLPFSTTHYRREVLNQLTMIGLIKQHYVSWLKPSDKEAGHNAKEKKYILDGIAFYLAFKDKIPIYRARLENESERERLRRASPPPGLTRERSPSI